MDKKYDILIFIGRFQPLHSGHLSVIDQATRLAKNVLVFVGSATEGRSLRNPWTFAERASMIKRSISDENIFIRPLVDYVYNDNKWIASIQKAVNYFCEDTKLVNPKIGLIGYSKDSSSYYLNLFPQWSHQHIDVIPYMSTKDEVLSSTHIRDMYFSQGLISGHVPYDAACVIRDVADKTRFLFDEYGFICKYKMGWSNAPYPPTFVTVDAVVIQSGHILLVKRKDAPGKNKFALPGGFIAQDEDLKSACIRELREETGIKVPEPVLYGSIKNSKTFDCPYRSMRGRTITTAFLIELTPYCDLPKIKGASDAKNAMWVPLGLIEPSEMFEDHYHIIENLVNL